jgi:hypothetical protein
VYITETAGALRVGTVFANSGGAYLSTQSGSIVDCMDHEFTDIKANLIVLNAVGGGIGEAGDYLDIDLSVNLLPGDTVDALGTGTLTATARDTIRISETSGNLNLRNVLSTLGDADLRADASILDAVDLTDPLDPQSAQLSTPASLPRADITARNVILTAGALGGIGVSGNDIDINSSHSGDGALTIVGTGLDAFIIETIGVLGFNTVSVGPDPNGSVRTAYLTAPNPGAGASQGRILNRAAPGALNVTSGKIWLFAVGDIGETAKPITTQAQAIEGKSTTGNVVIDNSGAIEVGGVISGSFNGESASGIQAGGSIFMGASSPVTLTENLTSTGQIVVIARDDADAEADDLTVESGIVLQTTALPGTPLPELQEGAVYTITGAGATWVQLQDADDNLVAFDALSYAAATHHLTPLLVDGSNELGDFESVQFATLRSNGDRRINLAAGHGSPTATRWSTPPPAPSPCSPATTCCSSPARR